jgi:hypothetical protein
VGRLSLEYQYAFDFCAVALQRVVGPIAVLASHPFYARELGGRLDGAQVRLFAVPNWRRQPENVRAWLGEQSVGAGVGLNRLSASSIAAVVWAEPEREGGPELLARIGQLIAPGGRLYVVTSSPMRRFLPRWLPRGWRPAQHPAGHRATLHWLQRAGWCLERRYGFHGPRSVLWGLAARVAAAWERRDWVDRCRAAMRVHYVVRGTQAAIAPVAVLVVRRDQVQ